jgi:hypothetical protein
VGHAVGTGRARQVGLRPRCKRIIMSSGLQLMLGNSLVVLDAKHPSHLELLKL